VKKSIIIYIVLVLIGYLGARGIDIYRIAQRENKFNLIKNGMQMDDCLKILGPPDHMYTINWSREQPKLMLYYSSSASIIIPGAEGFEVFMKVIYFVYQ